MENKLLNSDVANFLWVGNSLSLYERKCIESFVKHQFKVHVYSYGHLDLPEGAILKDGREILPESEVYSYTQAGKKGNLAAFSDVFRFELCKRRAGWWFDTDVFCLKNVKDWVDLAKSKENYFVFGWESEELVNGAVMYSDNLAFDNTIQKHLQIIGKDFIWGEIGPRLITKVVREIGLVDKVIKQNNFYPISFNNFDYLFDPKFKEESIKATTESFCVHLWNEFFTMHSIPKNIPPPLDSFLFELLSTHSILDKQYSLALNTLNSLLNYPKVVETLRVNEHNSIKGVIKRVIRKLRKLTGI